MSVVFKRSIHTNSVSTKPYERVRSTIHLWNLSTELQAKTQLHKSHASQTRRRLHRIIAYSRWNRSWLQSNPRRIQVWKYYAQSIKCTQSNRSCHKNVEIKSTKSAFTWNSLTPDEVKRTQQMEDRIFERTRASWFCGWTDRRYWIFHRVVVIWIDFSFLPPLQRTQTSDKYVKTRANTAAKGNSE